jgi:transcriptional/translational regulatory protein YebC/TACO1
MAEGDQWEVICQGGDLQSVRSELEAADVTIISADVTYLPATSVLVDAATAPKVLRLVDALDDLDDVQEVFANFEITAELLETLE